MSCFLGLENHYQWPTVNGEPAFKKARYFNADGIALPLEENTQQAAAALVSPQQASYPSIFPPTPMITDVEDLTLSMDYEASEVKEAAASAMPSLFLPTPVAVPVEDISALMEYDVTANDRVAASAAPSMLASPPSFSFIFAPTPVSSEDVFSAPMKCNQNVAPILLSSPVAIPASSISKDDEALEEIYLGKTVYVNKEPGVVRGYDRESEKFLVISNTTEYSPMFVHKSTLVPYLVPGMKCLVSSHQHTGKYGRPYVEATISDIQWQKTGRQFVVSFPSDSKYVSHKVFVKSLTQVLPVDPNDIIGKKLITKERSRSGGILNYYLQFK